MNFYKVELKMSDNKDLLVPIALAKASECRYRPHWLSTESNHVLTHSITPELKT